MLKEFKDCSELYLKSSRRVLGLPAQKKETMAKKLPIQLKFPSVVKSQQIGEKDSK